ncbi:hypothetical protein MEBOL_005875 [Melittangium boletus DSM 14713]|uniref:Uncharacterized protein n=2 Tax=Melittangium boletus TaxID=83453 RepID=A0A250IMK2_9BACT|nr:hypothetical protein MEBOL_005875 [Melittangium boletus DSM 14713]
MAEQERKAPGSTEEKQTPSREAGAKTEKHSSPGAPTNAQVKSGGNEEDDLVDEQSKESFPSSDAPSNY